VTEPDVTLTDYALALECAVLAGLIRGAPAGDSQLRRWFASFFACTGLAALAGGTVHGFFLDPESAGHALLWPATLILIGLTSLAAWSAGIRMIAGAGAGGLRRAGVFAIAVYAALVFFVIQRFWIAIAVYLPAAITLLGGMLAAWRRAPSRGLAWGVTGVVLVFPAALVQFLKLAPHPDYFNHNALYHLIQGVSLCLIFIGARAALAAHPSLRSAPC